MQKIRNKNMHKICKMCISPYFAYISHICTTPLLMKPEAQRCGAGGWSWAEPQRKLRIDSESDSVGVLALPPGLTVGRA